jgi:hypothetical protein
VQEAYVRVGALDHFAVQFQDQAKDAVRGRMLRAKVDRVVFDLNHYRLP